MATVIKTNLSETINADDGVTNGADKIYGMGGDDLIYALGGNDMIKGGGGADTIYGGAGFDMLNYTDSTEGVAVNLASGTGSGGTAEGDVIYEVEHVTGSYYSDALTGDGTGNILNALDGNDVLKGGGGNDVLYGGNGNDWLQGGTGADYIEGGEGIDTADYSYSAGAVNVHLSDGVGVWSEAAGDQLVGVENLTGSAFNDVLWGDGGANVLDGGAGNDDLQGAQGNDVLRGGADDDVLNGGTGNDAMFGGAGHDTYYVDSTGDVVIDFADQGYDVIYTSATYGLDLQSDIEAILVADPTSVTATNLAGNAFDQSIFGNDGINVINGHGGNDSLHGRGGDDQLYGGDGMDILTGGAGNDAFVFEAGFANGDIVVDFVGNGDTAGDTLHFIGYGPGAAFTQVDNTHWQIAYNGGASVEVITFLNGGAGGVHASDIVFV